MVNQGVARHILPELEVGLDLGGRGNLNRPRLRAGVKTQTGQQDAPPKTQRVAAMRLARLPVFPYENQGQLRHNLGVLVAFDGAYK